MSWLAAWAPTGNFARGWMRRRRAQGVEVFYPELELCTDNGAMIAFAAALRWHAGLPPADATFSVRPRWELATQASG